MQGEAGVALDHLDRRSVDVIERGAQDVVAVDDPIQRPLQGVAIEFARQAQGAGQVVGRTGRVTLVLQPQALLGERQGRAVQPAAGPGLPVASDILQQQRQQIII